MADLPFLKNPTKAPSSEDARVTRSRPNVNPNGQKLKAGGMWLVHCLPECDAEFRTGSHESVHDKQLEAASWQVLERTDEGSSKKVKIYRCPGHRIYDRSPMTGAPLDPRGSRETGNERKLAGRSSHDGGDK